MKTLPFNAIVQFWTQKSRGGEKSRIPRFRSAFVADILRERREFVRGGFMPPLVEIVYHRAARRQLLFAGARQPRAFLPPKRAEKTARFAFCPFRGGQSSG
jgi:hypothetical protein